MGFQDDIDRLKLTVAKFSALVWLPIAAIVFVIMAIMCGLIWVENYRAYGMDVVKVAAIGENWIIYGLTLASLWLVIDNARELLPAVLERKRDRR